MGAAYNKNYQPQSNGYWARARKMYRDNSDNYDCEECGNEKSCMCVHHIDNDYTNNNFSNLKLLCRDCHEEVHGR